MKPITISAEDETGKIHIKPEASGPGELMLIGPCVVDAIIDNNGKYHITGIKYGDEKDSISGEPKYNVGDIIKWQDNFFLIRSSKDTGYDTLSLQTGSSFGITYGYADSKEDITLEA